MTFNLAFELALCLSRSSRKAFSVLLKLLCKIGSPEEMDEFDEETFCSSWLRPEMQVKWMQAGEVSISHLFPGSHFSKLKNDIWGSGAAAQRLIHIEVKPVHFLTRSLPPQPLHAEPLHYRRGEAVQSVSAEPLCRAPCGPGPPAVPRWRLDPVQGTGSGGTQEAQRCLQEEITQTQDN